MDNTTNTTYQPAIIADLCQQLCTITTWQMNNESDSQDEPNEPMALSELPRNAITGKDYHGINIILLWTAMREKKYDSYEWATFKQWSAGKQSIRKGERGTIIIHYAMKEKEVDGKTKHVATLKLLRVFNRSQLKHKQADTAQSE